MGSLLLRCVWLWMSAGGALIPPLLGRAITQRVKHHDPRVVPHSDVPGPAVKASVHPSSAADPEPFRSGPTR